MSWEMLPPKYDNDVGYVSIISKCENCTRLRTKLRGLVEELRDAVNHFPKNEILDRLDDDVISGGRPIQPDKPFRIAQIKRYRAAIAAAEAEAKVAKYTYGGEVW